MIALLQRVGVPPPLSARSIRHVIGVLERLPAVVLADLMERLVDRLDALAGDLDLEPEADACAAEDVTIRDRHGPGDADDAEPEADDEPDEDAEDEVVVLEERPVVMVRYFNGKLVAADPVRIGRVR